MQITTSGGQSLNVRFGSKADIASNQLNVRFTPKSGHRGAHWDVWMTDIASHCFQIKLGSFRNSRSRCVALGRPVSRT